MLNLKHVIEWDDTRRTMGKCELRQHDALYTENDRSTTENEPADGRMHDGCGMDHIHFNTFFETKCASKMNILFNTHTHTIEIFDEKL